MSIVDYKVERCDNYIGEQGVRLSVDEWIEMLELLQERLRMMLDAARASL